jgi:prepilin-type processing-associated H-X9-DG protein
MVRTIVRVRRALRLALALSVAVAAVQLVPLPAGLSGLGGVSVSLADEHPIEVGTELMATTDVTLHKAEIAKGSRVSVTKLSESGGRVESVNVALADGHVVKMTIAQVHTFFRVVEE